MKLVCLKVSVRFSAYKVNIFRILGNFKNNQSVPNQPRYCNGDKFLEPMERVRIC